MDVATFPNHVATGGPDIRHRAVRGGENQTVNQLRPVQRAQRRMRVVDGGQIGEASRRDLPRSNANV